MTLAAFCESKNMTLQQYEITRANIKATASAMIQYIKSMYICDNGVYHPTKELNIKQGELLPFILYEMKQNGVEFIENGEYFRY